MIRDGAAGRFDFIITKEISRFSRSTLDSIRYTRELLDHNVGVLFQNDNINTVDPDSEFRLTIMAGVAQDEVRKLSQRLKFGFRQAVKNGRVLGNSQLWGYDKKDCVLTVNQREAQAVRQIFRLYALEGLGIRKISQRLTQQGFTSRQGGPFNELTIRHILQNPKYKGWYCGGKSQTVDYRSKRKVQLEESQWTTYRDPAIPALVSEELWDRANALYKRRSREMKARQQGAEYHRRYPYSGKIRCGLHGCSFHRRQQGEREVWECREYRRKGPGRLLPAPAGDKGAGLGPCPAVSPGVPPDRCLAPGGAPGPGGGRRTGGPARGTAGPGAAAGGPGVEKRQASGAEPGGGPVPRRSSNPGTASSTGSWIH